jgi:hypothetical protein
MRSHLWNASPIRFVTCGFCLICVTGWLHLNSSEPRPTPLPLRAPRHQPTPWDGVKRFEGRLLIDLIDAYSLREKEVSVGTEPPALVVSLTVRRENQYLYVAFSHPFPLTLADIEGQWPRWCEEAVIVRIMTRPVPPPADR